MSTQYNVTGYDIYKKTSESIKISPTLQDAILGKDIVFVAVQTPHDPQYDGSNPIAHLENKDFDYVIVKQVLTEINQYATQDQLVVLISTVLPGTTRREFVPLLTNCRFAYNPYLIAMGSVEWDMVNPEMVIIGTENDSLTGDAQQLIDFYAPLMKNEPRYEVGTWDEAECIKVFYNTFISAKIGLANMIQDVAMASGNINVDVVTNALAKSSMRIMGPKYMTAGMGDAGPCVLPSFKVTVNDQQITMADLYEKFNTEDRFTVVSATEDCDSTDNKLIMQVTQTPFSGEMIKFETAAGDLEVTPNHLIPITRNGVQLLIRADEVLITDELFSL
jgi:UDP-glucose 6-dehydrogenase